MSRTSRASGGDDTGDCGSSDARALAPVGVVLLVGLAAVLAGGVATATFAAPPEPPPSASLSLAVEGDRVTVRHRAGDPVPVDDLSLHLAVDGEPLARQPPVPFFSERGFRPGPTGAFNAASGTDELTAGDSASFRVAASNDPSIATGDTVTVRLTVRGGTVATLEARSTT